MCLADSFDAVQHLFGQMFGQIYLLLSRIAHSPVWLDCLQLYEICFQPGVVKNRVLLLCYVERKI